MFVDTDAEAKGSVATRLDSLARRYPGAFTLTVVLLAAAVSLGLLFNVNPPIVLYQGF